MFGVQRPSKKGLQPVEELIEALFLLSIDAPPIDFVSAAATDTFQSCARRFCERLWMWVTVSAPLADVSIMPIN